VIAYKGSIALKILVEGEKGHIAASPIRENAIEKAIALYQDLKRQVEEEGRSLFHSTTAHLIHIRGGEGGLVPSLCEIGVNIRFPPTRSSHEILDRIASSTRGMEGINIQVTGVTEGYESRRDSLIVLAAFRAIMKVRGEAAKLSKKTGTCDLNMLPRRVEGISLGPGDPLLEHTDREAIEVSQFLEAIDIYEQLILELFTLEKSRV
jgi:acetylornithine deacetylase/succinyl-diaminopimelate desuccinylase-like protein